jgi:hypothetical protein
VIEKVVWPHFCYPTFKGSYPRFIFWSFISKTHVITILKSLSFKYVVSKKSSNLQKKIHVIKCKLKANLLLIDHGSSARLPGLPSRSARPPSHIT